MLNIPYINDTYPDIVYLLVLNQISLQERIRLRAVCRRWRDIIEADCRQMSTLRLFGSSGQQFNYTWRSQHRQIKPPTAEEPLKHDPSPLNTIILKRPAFDRVDVHFLLRLFPSVTNLALGWCFGGQLYDEFLKKRKVTNLTPDDISEPDIFALLTFWAPNLRELYLATPQHGFGKRNRDSEEASLNICRTHALWRCLSLMAPTLRKLTLQGVDLNRAPKSLTLPLLEEISYFSVYKIYPDPRLVAKFSKLSKLAPALRAFRLPKSHHLAIPRNIWPLTLPESVSRLAIYVTRNSKPSDHVTPCPAVSHLEVQFGDYITTVGVNVLNELPAKFPNIKYLALPDAKDLPHLFTERGEDVDTVAFLFTVAHRPPTPFDKIEELYLGSFTVYLKDLIELYKYRKIQRQRKPDYDAIFRGIAVIFRGLKKLTLAIEPDTEVKHQAWHKEFTDLKGRYMPKVELTFALEMSVSRRLLAFRGGRETVSSTSSTAPLQCHLSPGCVFVRQVNAEGEATNSNKRQRT